MLPSYNGIAWLEGEEDEGISWAVKNNNEGDSCKDLGMNASSLTSFKSMLETDWFANNTTTPPQNILTNHQPDFNNGNLLLQTMDSSSSCSPAPSFTLDPSQSHIPFFPPKYSFSSLFNAPFDNNFDLDCELNFLTNSNFPVLPNPEMTSGSDFAATRLQPIYDNNDNSIGTANQCPTIDGGIDRFAFKPGKYNAKKFCLELTSFTVKAESVGKNAPPEFQKTKLMTRLTYTLDEIEGPFEVSSDGTVKFEEKDGIDYTAVTVQLPS